MKKKPFDYRWLIGGIASFGVISGAIVVIAKYILLPGRVEAVEKTVQQISDYIKEQQIYNNAVQTILSNQQAPEEKIAIRSPDGKLWYDKSQDKWRPIKELPHE